MCIQALFSEFAYPACESFHEIKAVQVTRRQKSVAFGQSTAISLKDMNDSNESYVAVLVLGCIWHEDIHSLSAACSCSIVRGIFISLPKILFGFFS